MRTSLAHFSGAGMPGRPLHLKKFGVWVVLAFTLKGILTTSLLAMVLLGLAP